MDIDTLHVCHGLAGAELSVERDETVATGTARLTIADNVRLEAMSYVGETDGWMTLKDSERKRKVQEQE
jgi:hypothetical protein